MAQTNNSKDLKKIVELMFPSRVRISILTLFFTNIEKGYHMRYISRYLKAQINAVRRELLILESVGFLRSETDGMKKMFYLNQYFPLYSDLRGIIMKSFSLGYHILLNQEELGEIKYAVLSHTYMNREASDQHNIDLLLVGNVNTEKLNQVIQQAQQEEDKELFCTVISEMEFENRKKRRDPIVYSMLVLPRGLIIGKDEEFVV